MRLKASFSTYRTLNRTVHNLMESQIQSSSHSSATTIVTTPTTTLSGSPFFLFTYSSFSLRTNMDFQFLLRLFAFSLTQLSPFLGCHCSFPTWLYLLLLVVPPQLPILCEFLPFSWLLFPQLSNVHFHHLLLAFWLLSKTCWFFQKWRPQ